MSKDGRESKREGFDSRLRFANGVLCLFLVCFFTAHALLGSLHVLASFPNSLEWLVWFGVAGIVIHVVTCAVTNWLMFTDTERPPSQRKKNHMYLKWATGGVLACAIVAHIAYTFLFGGPGFFSGFSGFAVMMFLIVMLVVHLWVGSKSLTRDLNLDKRWRVPFRVAVCFCAAVFVILTLARL